LSARTRRTFNAGLLGATLATVLGVVVILVASLSAIGDARASQTDGTMQVQVLAAAQVEALQARSDETIVQILQGNGGSYETAFTTQSGCLRGQLKQAGGAVDDQASRTLVSWLSTHDKVETADATGDYATAVGLTIGPNTGNTSGFADQVDNDISQGITSATARFDNAVTGARDDLASADAWFAILLALAVVGMAAGLWPRIAEYR
jgi:hypothetical protein